MLIKIENHWRDKIKESLPKASPSKKKYYVLSMFPYPSGKLHMGHVRVYSLSDAFAHYYRMRGYNVIHPMGWDAFGLPAENAAIENKLSPKDWTETNIAKMKDQLIDLGCIFDWDREIATCDPSYYKWTQHLFLELQKAGLVFQKESVVNWDPVDQTVLADEQVDNNGCSWRSGAKVEKKPLRQWFFRTTQFCESLLQGLDDPSLVNWRDIVKAQSNWIGKCNGTKIDFKIESECGSVDDELSMWTQTPEFIFATEFIAIHPDHILNNSHTQKRLIAVNPFSGEKVPVIMTSDLEYDYGSQTIHGIPSVKEELKDFAVNNNISCNKSVLSIKGDETVLTNSGEYTGMTLKDARKEVMSAALERGIGGYPVSSNLQDWLISRQRYWGTPIPMVHCSSCGTVPVPQADLPVELPVLDGLSAKGASPLLAATEWLKTTCPGCGGPATRETDTMDTFVDSSWYYLRYLDPKNSEEPFSSEAVKDMPVDLYIGGKEHAYLHLYFARFFAHFLHSIGKLETKEPFINLITQGMVRGKSYRVKGSQRYLKPEDTMESEGKTFESGTGSPVVVEWEKMSKSKYNGVDPSALINKYGCDTVRMMILTNVGPYTDRNWSEAEHPGIRNMQIKLWKLVQQAIDLQKETLPELRYDEELNDYRKKLRDARNYNTRFINHQYLFTRNLAVVIARIHAMVGVAWTTPGQVKRDAAEFQHLLGSILILLAPIAPHFTSELWAGLRTVPVKHSQDLDWNAGLFQQTWPEVDPTYNMPIKVVGNNKVMAEMQMVKWRFDELTLDQAFDLACHENTVQESILPYDILDKSLEIQEGYAAILNIQYKEPENLYKQTKEEFKVAKAKEKEEKRQMKEARRIKREETIRRLHEAEAAKAAKPIYESRKLK